MKMTKVLLIIDPQNDFMDSPDFAGSLAVTGAFKDMQRLSSYIDIEEIDAIFVTLDTHSKNDIAHAMWWVNEQGENPPPFTEIKASDVENGVWKAADAKMQAYSLFYVKQLEQADKYTLRIWPYHCIENTPGHKIEQTLATSLENWEARTGKKVYFIHKGTNPKTEHYSGFKAEVELDDDSTKLNMRAIRDLAQYDVIEIAGEASSHCTGASGIDLLENLQENERNKVFYLTNCMSPVTGFEQAAQDLMDKAVTLGATLKTVPELRAKMQM
jgi:nicotinamidase/pyrazinamidase